MNADAVIESVVGTAVPVLGNDLDTDRIIPARFLKEITFENMGSYCPLKRACFGMNHRNPNTIQTHFHVDRTNPNHWVS